MRSELFRSVMTAGIFGLFPNALPAADIEVQVTDKDGKAVEHAVVYVEIPAGKGVAEKQKTTVIDQVNKEFVSHVTAVQTGTRISFPNKDQIRHHVYSFSPAKPFEIPLYKGTPSSPIVFDKPGVVVLGCNIHDWMSAYVYVVDTPFFAVTDSKGSARLKNLPQGNHRLLVWHPLLKGKPEATAQQMAIANQTKKISSSVGLRRAWMARRGPGAGGGGYR